MAFVLEVRRSFAVLSDHPVHFFRVAATGLLGHFFLEVHEAPFILPAGGVADRGKDAESRAVPAADILGALVDRQVALNLSVTIR